MLAFKITIRYTGRQTDRQMINAQDGRTVRRRRAKGDRRMDGTKRKREKVSHVTGGKMRE